MHLEYFFRQQSVLQRALARASYLGPLYLRALLERDHWVSCGTAELLGSCIDVPCALQVGSS